MTLALSRPPRAAGADPSAAASRPGTVDLRMPLLADVNADEPPRGQSLTPVTRGPALGTAAVQAAARAPAGSVMDSRLIACGRKAASPPSNGRGRRSRGLSRHFYDSAGPPSRLVNPPEADPLFSMESAGDGWVGSFPSNYLTCRPWLDLFWVNCTSHKLQRHKCKAPGPFYATTN